MARALSDKLKAALGGTWIVDNRPGGSGQVGMPVEARSPADGYTLAVSPASSLTTDRSIFKSLQYDPESDFTPISRRVNRPMAPMVKDKQKYRTVAALLAAARAAPGQMSHASSGEGSPQHPAPPSPLGDITQRPNDSNAHECQFAVEGSSHSGRSSATGPVAGLTTNASAPMEWTRTGARAVRRCR